MASMFVYDAGASIHTLKETLSFSIPNWPFCMIQSHLLRLTAPEYMATKDDKELAQKNPRKSNWVRRFVSLTSLILFFLAIVVNHLFLRPWTLTFLDVLCKKTKKAMPPPQLHYPCVCWVWSNMDGNHHYTSKVNQNLHVTVFVSCPSWIEAT